jgi:hypothetical protein
MKTRLDAQLNLELEDSSKVRAARGRHVVIKDNCDTNITNA